MLVSNSGPWMLLGVVLLSGSAFAQDKAADASNPDKAFLDAIDKVDDAFRYSANTEAPLATMRPASAGRAKLRQAEFETNKSYRIPAKNRCVFASEPFGAGLNQGLSYYFSAATPKVYVRCYISDEVKSLLASGWQPFVKLSVNWAMGWGSPAAVVQVPGDDKTVLEASFELPPPELKKDDFAVLDVDAGLEKVTGYRGVGAKAVPTYDTKKLGKYAFLWEKQAR